MEKHHLKKMRLLFYIFFCLTLSSCTTNYTLTTFYVKNSTDKTVNFKVSVLKYSSMGQFEMTLPFTVLPKDSVLARKVNFRKNILPNLWFTQFTIFPIANVVFNDPNLPTNWIRSTNAKGEVIYTFNIVK
jgi:hypothetical protein